MCNRNSATRRSTQKGVSPRQPSASRHSLKRMRHKHGPLAYIIVVAALSSTATGQHRNAMPPPPARVQQLQLSRPFTLTYMASGRGLAGESRRPYRVRLTLSYDGKNLLYRTQYLATPKSLVIAPVTITKLFDGRETYTAESNSKMASIEPGIDFYRDLLLCPLPGAGIPYVPLFTYGIPPEYIAEVKRSLNAKLTSEPRYVAPALYRTPNQTRDIGSWSFDGQASHSRPRSHPASVVTVQSGGLPKALWYDTFDNIAPCPGNLWEFFSHRRFQDAWIATKMRRRWYSVIKAGVENTLLQDTTYALESAVPSPLKRSAYDPETYLPEHANVTDLTGPSVRTFLYEPGRGTLGEQRGKGEDVSQRAATRVRNPVNTGAIGLVALAVASVLWFVWRKKQLS